MNSSVEETRQRPVNELKSGFYLEIDTNDISLDESEFENYYLDTSGIDESLLEQFRAAEAETMNFNGSNLLSLESYEVQRPNTETSQSKPQPKQSTAADEKSMIVNCKTFCKDLMKPITDKIIKKLLRKKSDNKDQSKKLVHYQTQHLTLQTRVAVPTPTPQPKVNRRVHLKLVPSVQPAHLNMIPSESTKAASNRFSNFGDIVYYNI